MRWRFDVITIMMMTTIIIIMNNIQTVFFFFLHKRGNKGISKGSFQKCFESLKRVRAPNRGSEFQVRRGQVVWALVGEKEEWEESDVDALLNREPVELLTNEKSTAAIKCGK